MAYKYLPKAVIERLVKERFDADGEKAQLVKAICDPDGYEGYLVRITSAEGKKQSVICLLCYDSQNEPYLSELTWRDTEDEDTLVYRYEH